MRFSIILIAIIFVFLPLSDLYAGTIYSWTDKNGTKKYSNTAPEEDVENLKVIEEMPISEEDVKNPGGIEETSHSETDDNAIDIDNDELSHYLKEMEIKKKQPQIKTEEEKNKTADDPFNEKILTEKRRLQGEIDRIEKLAVGPSLSIARKNAMIKQFQDKLDLLEKSPEEYFGASETE